MKIRSTIAHLRQELAAASSAALAFAGLFAAAAPASLAGANGDPDVMNYQVLETYYGPEVRFKDWQVTSGELLTDHTFRETRGAWRPGGEGVNALFSAGGGLQVFTTEKATVTRSDLIFGGGGDVELSLLFELERMGEDGEFTIRFHDARAGGDGSKGISVFIDREGIALLHRGELVHEEARKMSLGQPYFIALATLANGFRLDFEGDTLFTGSFPVDGQDNEGWTHFDLTDAGVRIHQFTEKLIVADQPFSSWEREELLYEEEFGNSSFQDNWILNGEAPDVTDTAFTFQPMSNVILNRHFEGPVAVDIEATPVPTPDHSAGITDAIFIWMMSHPEEDLADYMRGLPDAERQHYLPLSFYWMDFGGTNNVTTRFRRSPGLRMIRQFTDSARLMDRDRSYRVTLVQNEDAVEFWIDGQPWIRARDPEALTSGYIGHRAFNSQLKISSLKIWRIR